MTQILDHIGLKVSDFAISRAFYTEVLATLGISLLSDFTVGRDQHAGFGIGNPTFWIGSGKIVRADSHIAFIAASRAEVHAFYTVALSIGGRDNGAPGPRPHYHRDYYGAFVFDPDGHNLEAVCRKPEAS